MKNQKLVSLRPVIVITASAILSVLFILILYYADNKYTVGESSRNWEDWS